MSPAPGTTSVPRDAQIVVATDQPDDLQLRANDRVVPTTTKVVTTSNKARPYFVTLVPDNPLSVSTQYSVTQYSQSLSSFLTGVTFASTEVATPAILNMEAHRASIATSFDATCWWGGQHEQISASFDAPERVSYYEFAFLANGVQRSLVTTQPFITASNDCFGSLPPRTVVAGATICARVRAVGLNGVISEGSATQCATVDVCDMSDGDPYRCQDSGCAAGGNGMSALVIGALLLLRATRRRHNTRADAPTHHRDPR